MDAGLNSTALQLFRPAPNFAFLVADQLNGQPIDEGTVGPNGSFTSRQGQPFETVVWVGLAADAVAAKPPSR